MKVIQFKQSFLTAIGLVLLITACSDSTIRTAQNSPLSTVQPQDTAAKATARSIASKTDLDEHCQPTSTADTGWKVIQQSAFVAEGASYLLSTAQYQDGTTELCLSRPNFEQARSLDGYISGYIDAVRPSRRVGVFQVMVHEGNGGNLPPKQYQLDLTHPQQPQAILASSEAPQSPAQPASATSNQPKPADSQTLSNGEWTVTIGNLNSWSGVNNTGNLSYHGCNASGECIDLTGGVVSERQGSLSFNWQNGDYSYMVSSPVAESIEASAAAPSTLVVYKGDQEILRTTELRSRS